MEVLSLLLLWLKELFSMTGRCSVTWKSNLSNYSISVSRSHYMRSFDNLYILLYFLFHWRD